MKNRVQYPIFLFFSLLSLFAAPLVYADDCYDSGNLAARPVDLTFRCRPGPVVPRGKRRGRYAVL